MRAEERLPPLGESCPRSGLMRDGLAVIALLRRSIGKRTPHPTSLRPATFPQRGKAWDYHLIFASTS